MSSSDEQKSSSRSEYEGHDEIEFNSEHDSNIGETLPENSPYHMTEHERFIHVTLVCLLLPRRSASDRDWSHQFATILFEKLKIDDNRGK